MAKIGTGAGWKLNGVDITVITDSLDIPEIRFGKHSILDSTKTVLHLISGAVINRKLELYIWEDVYDSEILPLVGSGYWAFISDIGAEGNYYIMSCSPERVEDTKTTTPICKLNLVLRKA